MKKLLAVLLCLGLCGCITMQPNISKVQSATSGIIGCQPNEIVITNFQYPPQNGWTIQYFPLSFTAYCSTNKKVYYCSQAGAYLALTCTEAK